MLDSTINLVYIGPNDHIRFVYHNYRGEKKVREAYVIGFKYGATEYHTEPQWFVHCEELSKGFRTFAAKDMSEITLIRKAR